MTAMEEHCSGIRLLMLKVCWITDRIDMVASSQLFCAEILAATQVYCFLYKHSYKEVRYAVLVSCN